MERTLENHPQITQITPIDERYGVLPPTQQTQKLLFSGGAKSIFQRVQLPPPALS